LATEPAPGSFRSVGASRRGILVVSAWLAAVALPGCESPPSVEELHEWTPQDHDRSDEKERVASGAQAAPAASSGKEDATRTLAEVTWRNQCAQCHGVVGRGDGPSGPMVRATDLTQEAWQAEITDEQIAASIRNGKGKMPRFDLPPNVVSALIGRIRSSRGR
jgi:cytochrome c oxidase cbb3-type subunit 3